MSNIHPLDKPRVLIDFETRSELDVRNTGAWRYASDASTLILCMSYKLPNEDTKLWLPCDFFPLELIDAVEDGYCFEAHNVQFERAVWRYLLDKPGVCKLPQYWTDTVASCAYRAVPMGLDAVGEVLDLPIKKDKRGKYLLQRLSKPRKPTKKDKSKWCNDPDLLQELYDYCIKDTDAEFTLGQTIGDLPRDEYNVWHLDQKINARGVRLDLPAVNSAIIIANKVSSKLVKELTEITDGAVTSGSQIAKIVEWLNKNDVKAENLTKDGVEEMLTWNIPDVPRRVLEIRQQLSKASTKKLDKMLDTVSPDGRIRGLLAYHGAGTGRWAGRLVQPQNFPRGNPAMAKDLDTLMQSIRTNDPELLTLLYGDPMEAVSSALRGMFIPSEGHRFLVADFSAIEARVAMWVAQQQSALDAFAAYDRGEGPDIYCVMAEKLYNRAIDAKVDKDERQLGKITILGAGFQMGGARLKEQAATAYKVFLEEEEAAWLIDTYRDEYPEVKNLWYGIQDAVLSTVRTKNPHSYRCLTFKYITDNAGDWLAIELPNGRHLWYFNPGVEIVERDWGPTPQFTYEGRDNKKSGKWGKVYSYGGMLTENVVQAIARDLMVEAMMRVEKKGYKILLTVHDEIISEAPNGFGSIEEYNQTMTGPVPDWAEGCPVGVEGWELDRYRKL